MPEKGKIEDLTKSLKTYIHTNIELIKLEGTERVSVIGSSLISLLIVGTSVFIFILFLSIGAGFYLSNCYDDNFTGFAIVAGFYFILSLLLIICRKKFIESPIRDKIIQKIFNK